MTWRRYSSAGEKSEVSLLLQKPNETQPQKLQNSLTLSDSNHIVGVAATTHSLLTTMQAIQSSTLRPAPLDPLRKRTHFPNVTSKPACKRVSFISASSVSAPKREKDPKKRVVITGLGLVSVFGNDVNSYYDKLLAGESGVGPIDRFDASKFPTRFGGQIRGFTSEGYIDGKNDRRLDDCLRYAIVAGKKALEDADLGADNRPKVTAFFHFADLIWFDYVHYSSTSI